MKRASLLLLLVCAFLPIARAQVQTGTPTFGTFGGGPDIINLANLNSQLTIPIINKPGRGMHFTYSLFYNSSIWTAVNSSGTIAWTPATNWGWTPNTPVGYLQVKNVLVQTQCMSGRRIGKISTLQHWWTLYDGNGPHSFGWEGDISNGCTGQNTQINLNNDDPGDGSGYRITVVNNVLVSLYGPNGASLALPIGNSSTAIEDSNGNEISETASGVFTDTLGTTALTIGGVVPAITYSYTAPSGATATYTVNYTSYTVATNFGISGVTEFAPTAESLVSTIVLPDGSQYTFTYEPTPSTPSSGACTPLTGTYAPNCVTARIKSVSFPAGGMITYSYSGGNNGILRDGTTATLTRTTPDGTWTYAHTEPLNWTTTVTDPQNNQTVYNFEGIYQTERKVFAGSSTLLKDDVTCYNGNTTNCTSTAVLSPITERLVTDTLGSQQCKHNYVYTQDGLITEQDDYDYGTGAPGNLLRTTLTTYGSLGNILNEPASITVKNASGSIVAQTTYQYDQTALTTLSGTPQVGSVSGSRGNLTTMTISAQGTASLSKTFTYYNTGNVAAVTDVNGAQTTYNYPDATSTCGNAFPTSVSEPLSLSRSMAWNCTGGVETSAMDENGQTVSILYTDADFWRPASTKDQELNTTNFTYVNQNSVESSLLFNSGSSITDSLMTLDGLGRSHVSQKKQSPSASGYDSVETDYDAIGRPSRTTTPYSGTAGQTNGAVPATTQTYDALNRPLVTTDGGGGTVTLSYTGNDTLQSVGPAPTGENTKRRQSEYNSIGQLTSVCEVTSLTGSGTCGQTTSATGYWTKYTYDALGDLLTVTQNAQGASTQSRSYTYDQLSRMTSETNPETGAISYVFDTDATCGTSKGDLVKRTDAAGNVTCYAYDARHRQTSVTYPSGPNSSNTPGKFYVYDSATVNGVVMVNSKSRLAEAYTATCQTCSKITDEGFSYTVRGEISDEYQMTPHSGGYYHAAATYWANGVVNTLTGAGTYATNYNLDGEGRVLSAGPGGNELASTTYNVASQPTIVTFASLDSDSFIYDPTTFRMTQYKYTVGATPQSVVGNLTWNANGTLSQLAITDPFNATNTQTCTYSHDDLARIASGNCGSIWSQTFSYDAFGNLTKAGSNSFNPGYNPITNRMSSGATYDANGDVLTDSLHSYAWDVERRPTTIDTVIATYDALGRMVEQTKSGASTEIQYSPTGFEMETMNGSSFVKAFVPMPGGTEEVWQATGASPYYRHADWVGSSRFASTTSRTMYNDLAYAPFGEQYAQSGSTGVTDTSFAANNEDTSTNLYDAQHREYEIYGRWPSPDPAGIAAANPMNPQSWNRYAYVLNNPLGVTDPTGLAGMSCRRPDKDPTLCENGGGMPSNCIIDGVEQPCSLVTGAGDVECPNDVCQGLNSNGQPVYFWASTNGSGSYYTYSGPGALYYSLQAAGIAALNYIFQNDTSLLHEYGGNIYADANGVYSFTNPNFDPASPPCDINGPPCFYTEDPNAIPQGTTLTGIFHTHPFGGIYDSEDIGVADDVGVPSFLGYPPGANFGPSGCIWMYTPGQVPATLLQGLPGACQ